MPECLSPGDTYRVLFLTNARRNATATDAATYDNFARGQASTNGTMDFDAVTFQALISTAGESMRARTNTDPVNNEPGEPIFFYRGDKVADNYADFYDLSWDTDGQWNQRGDSLGTLSGDSFRQVWTGSTADGAISTGQTPGSTMVAYGEPSIAGEQFFSGTGDPSVTRRLYALSNILMIPEPPILQSATIDGATLLLTYSEALDDTSTPSAGAYTVMVGGSAGPDVNNVEISGMTVTLTLSTAVSSDQTVTLDYAVPGSDPIQDADGNEAAALDGQAVENNTPPILQTATVNGATLVLTYNDELDDTSPPSAGAYMVMVSSGAAPTVSTVAISGRIVTLTLSPAVSSDQTVTLDYEVPGSNPIQDADGNEAAALNGQPVENNTPPILESATVNVATLVLTYSEALDDTSTPSTGAYTVMVGGSAGPDVNNVEISGMTVTLTLSAAVSNGQMVTLDYAVPGSDPIQDADGNEAAALTGRVVENNTPPILESATVDGATLVLTYNAVLDTSPPSTGAYTVMVGSSAGPDINNVEISGMTVTLTLATAVTAGQMVTLDYRSGTPGSTPIQDADGNEAAALTGRVVENNTPPIPILESATIDGATLVLTYDEELDDTSPPSAGAYTVMVRSGAAPPVSTPVSTVAIDPSNNRIVTLTLSTAVTAGQTVTLDYRSGTPGSTPIQDTDGNEADELDDQAVENNTLPRLSDLKINSPGSVPSVLVLIQLPPTEVPSGTPAFICSESLAVQSATKGFDSDIFEYIACAESSTTGNANTRNIIVTPIVADTTNEEFEVFLGSRNVGTASQVVTAAQVTARIEVSPTSGSNITPYTVQIFPLPPRPVLERAIVRDTRLFLVYSRQLDTTSIPSPGDFEVRVQVEDKDPIPNTVTDVAIRSAALDSDRDLVPSGTQVVALELTTRVNFGNEVTLTYMSGSNPLRDGVNGDEAAPLVPHPTKSDDPPIPPSQVASNLTPQVPARPVIIRANRLNNFQLTLTLGVRVTSPLPLFFGLFRPLAAGRNVDIPGFTVVDDLTGASIDINDNQGGTNRFLDAIPLTPLMPDPSDALFLTVPLTLNLDSTDPDFEPTAASYTVTYEKGSDPDRRLQGVDVNGEPARSDDPLDPFNTEVDEFTRSTDTDAPTVSSVAITSTTGPYAEGEVIEVTVTFNEVVGVNETVGMAPHPIPQIPLQLDAGTTVQALYTEGMANRGDRSFSETLVFSYTVQPGDTDTDGVSIAANALADALTTTPSIIQDPAGNNAVSTSNPVTAAPAHIVDTTPPTVDSVAITSITDPYAQDEEIEVSVTFDEPVTVSGTPAITLLVGATLRPTTAVSVSSSNTVVLTYTVVAGDNDADGVSIAANALSLPVISDDLIQDLAGNNAVLTHEEVPAATAPIAHIVDTTPPALMPDDGATINGATLTLTYDEPLDDSSMPSPTTYMVTVSPGTAPTVNTVTISGDIVTLTLSTPVSSDQMVGLIYTVPGSNPIQDLAGNDAAALNIQVTNNTPPPQISIAADTSDPVPEGTTVSFTVTATAVAPPASDLAVTVNVGQTGDFLSDPPDEQTVTILANQFTVSFTVATVDDNIDEADGSVTATVTAGAGAGYTIAAPPANTASVTVTDDDDAGVTVSQPMVTVLEDGSTATYTVVLDTEPTADVTITPTSDGTSVATVSAALTFTPTNWNTAQTVTVTGVNDDVDNTGNQRTATVNHAATSTDTNYEAGSMVGSNIASVTVTATDDDTADVTVTESDGATTVAEPSGTDTYTVVLTTQPTGDVTITPASDDTLVAMVSGVLTFTTTDWNMEQTVTVTVVDDNIDNTGNARTTTVTHAIAGGGYDSVGVADVEVTATDDDDARVTVSGAALTVDPEAGGMATYTVVLVTQPTAEVTITPASDDTSVALVSGALTFTTANWNTPQPVTVTGVNDDIDNPGNARTATVSHTAASTDTNYEASSMAGSNITSVTVTTTDDDTAGVRITPTTLAIDEGGTSTYTVRLDTQPQPTDDVAVTVGGESGDVSVTGSPVTLTFTTGNWNIEQTVTVNVAEDDDAVADSPVTLTHAVTGYGTVSRGANVVVTVDENDTAGVTVAPTMVTVAPEAGGTADYTVVLDTQPTAEVTITPASGDTSVALVSGALTFTTMNWNTSQTVTVTGVDDDIDNTGNVRTTTVTHAATSSDVDYEGEPVDPVMVTATDDDTADVTVTETDSDTTVAEPSGTDTYTVVLTTQPTGDVTITPASDDTSVAMVSGALTFTTMNWNMEQTVTVTVVDDNIDNTDDERTTTVTHVAASTDGNYERFTVDSVAVTATDDDGPPSLAINSPSVPEGNSGTVTLSYTVTLTGATEREVTVAYADAGTGTATSDGTDYDTITGGTLTFTPGTTTQNIDVTVTGDTIDEENETVVVELSNPVNATITPPDGTGTGTITDDDDPPTLAIDSLPVNEGDDGATMTLTYTVTLTGETARTVMVDYADAGATGGGTATSGIDYDTITGGTLTFTPGTTTQNIGVTVRGDTIDEGDETFVVRLSNPTNAMITTADGTGTIMDDDTVGVTVTPLMVTVTEEDGSGRTATYTLVLNTQPTDEVTITPASDDTSVALVSGVLTFTTTDWNVAQTITVTGVDDDIDSDRTTSVTHPAASSDSGYDMVPIASVTVTVMDNDTANVTVTESDGGTTVAEPSGTDTYTVVLDTEPTGNVIITPTSDDTSVAIVSGVLIFTTTNWNMEQTVTVTVVDDDIHNTAGGRTTTVTHVAASTDGNYERFTVDSVAVTATDDDDPPLLAIDSLTVTEGDDGDTMTLRYTVTLTGATEREVTVDYADAGLVGPGRATSGIDYDTITGGTLTFTPGDATTQNIDVTVTGDNIDEGDETVVVRLSNPTNATITSPDGTGTITDDDTVGVTVSETMVTVPENGGMADYTVVLDTQPTAEVTITPASDDTSVALVSGALTFTTTDWNTAQTVTVTGVDDVIDSDRTATVTHMIAGGGYDSVVVDDVMVTATDDDTAGLTFDPASVSVNEGDSSSYTVVLNTEPTVTVTVAITAGGDVSTNLTSLTFTTTDWNTAQTVTVNATEDADGINDSQTLAHTASGAEYDTVAGDVMVTVIDSDTPNVTVTPVTVNVDEAGGTVDYTVVLNTQPTAEVTITPASDDTSVALVSGALTFTTTDWDTAQTVTVTGVDDVIDSDRTTTVTHLAASTDSDYDSFDVDDVMVTATDNDTAGLTFDPAAVNVTEGGSSSYTVVLNTEPTVTVTVAIPAVGDVTADPASLTFTTSNWNTAQTVTVNAGQDVDGNDETETLAHTASGAEYDSVTGAVMVTVMDNDTPNVTVTPTMVTVDEGGGTADYTVVLATQPTAEVTITPASDDTSVALVSGALTFTTTDWDTAQTVTVTGVNDNIDNTGDQRTTTVTHLAASTDSDYNSFDVDDVMVTATDNDTAGLTFDPAAVNVTEGDSSSYTVELATEPTDTVTVAIPAVGDVTADPASLTFTTTDWNTAQTVTVTAVEDADGNNDIEMLAHTASGGEYDSVTDTVMVTVTDNDAPGVTVSESALTVDPEAGGTADYTVVLVTQPTADVTITPASDDTSVALVSGVLTFTTTDWNVAQTVTVTGVNDNIDNVSDRTATVTHAATSSDVDYEGVPVDPVMVTATDNDTAGLTFDPASVSVNEGGSSSYTVVLDTEPTVTVTVAITAGGDVSTNLTSLTFTTTDWNTAQTVTVTAAEDADGNNDSVTLAHAASGGEYDTVAGTVMVTVIDDDAPNVTVTPVTVDVDEAGGTVDYTVVLNTQPTAEVTITPASDDTSVALVSGALTFTTTDWNTAQTVTVTGVNDNIDNTGDERTTTVTHLAASTDSDYNSFDVDDVMVTATDDDTAGLTFDPASVNVLEGDSSSYTVELATEPTTTVTVAIPAVGDVTADPASLTFTTSNWNTAQTVTVTAAEDADGNNDIEMLAHTASGGEYDSVTDTVMVTVTDNDAPGVTVSESALTVDPEAGGTADYTVVLVTQPTADVTITPASDDTSVALVSGVLTFTTTDWNTAQTVTVTGVNDDIDNTGDERITTVTHAATSSDVDYEGVPVAPVMVTANDDDTAGLTFDPASVNVLEGDSSSYTVELATEPTTTVTVAITAGGDVSTNPASLTFTTSDWNTAQTVTVTAAEDADGNNDSETLAHAASGGEYDTVAGTVMVTVIDDDAPNVTVTPVTIDVDEAGGTVDYTVVLNTQPTADVTITPASDDTSVALVSGALTFTTTDWNTAQTVTVTGVNDNIDNTGDERTTTVTHLAASTDSDYNSFDVDDVMVTATDDDTAGLTFDPASVNVDEGDSSSYTVELATEPTTTVTVAIPAVGDVTADPASLTFTTSNWNTAQTVTVTAVEDADGNNDIEMLAHTASGGEYDSVTDTVMVTVTDNDAPGVTVSESALTVDPEAGGTADYTVVLVTQPTADVTITPASDDTSVALVSGALTFTTTDWNTAQTVTVTGVNDDIDNTGDERITTVTHAATSSDVDYEGVPVAPVMVTANDDDTAGLTFDPASVNVLEGDSSSYTVELATEPTTTVTVAITASGDVTADPASLTFTTSDWNTAQTVMVTAAEDADGNNDSETLAHAASGGEYGSVTGTVMVTVMDNDAPGVTVSESALTVDPEAGGTADYTVVLVTQPMADVTITPASDDTSVALVSGALTFTTTDWDTAQTVTVTGVNDDIDNTGDERITTVTHAATSSDVDYEGVPVAPVMVTANDDDTAGLTFDPASVSVNEGDSSSYTVVLDTEPTTTVTVAITAGGDVTTNPTSLTFTTTDWNTAQTVMVTSAQDADGINDSQTLAHTASGAEYDSVTGTVVVTVIDDEVPGVRISTTTLTVPEGGPNTYTVRLNTQPTEDVMVTVNGASGDVSFSGSPLTFTTINWATEQTVTVNAAEDDDAAPDAMVTLTHGVTGYGSVTSGPDVVVTVTEDDTARVTVSPTTLTVFEKGGTVDYTVALTTQPTGDVTITPASGDTSVATVSAALTFTTTDWNTPQTVTVTGMDDGIDNPSDRTATVSHTIAGGDYGSVSVADVAVTAIDANQTLVGFGYNPGTVPIDTPTPPDVSPPTGVGDGSILRYVSTTLDVCTVDSATGALTLVTAGDCNIEVTASDTPNFNEETVDFTVMVLPVVTLNPVAGNDIVNIEEHMAGFNISGMVSVGATEVSVTLGGGGGRDATVTDTNWTLLIPPNDAEIVGTSVEVVATATVDGNTGTASQTIGVDLVAPTLQSAVVNGDTLTLTYDMTLDGSSIPSTTTYTVEVVTPDMPLAVNPVDMVTISGMIVTLRLSTAVTSIDELTLDYVPPSTDPVQDENDNDAAELTDYPVTNNTSAGLTPRQARRLHEEILPQVAQAAAVNFTASMGERIDTVIGGAVLPAEGLWLDGQRIDGDKKAVLLGFLEKAPEYRLSIKEDTLNWKRMLGNSSFVLNLAGENGAHSGASLWGSGYYTDFDSEVNADSDNEALKWDGGSFGFQIGADTRMTDNLLTGVAVSWVEGDMEYTLGSGDTRNEGDYTLTLTGIHPYVGWSDDDDRWSLWSSAGYAKGKVEIEPDEASRQKYDTSLVSIAGGFKRKLSDFFNIKGDFSVIEIDVDESHDVEDDRGLSIDSQRLRLLLEAKNKRTLADGGLLTHSGEIGYRVDEGDSETDSDGAELGASIDYHNPATNFTLAGKVRALVGNGDHQDWGISGLIRLQPDRYGQGISFTLEPGYGNTSGSADDLWDRRPSPLPIERSDYSARMKAHLGYGLYGFVTPYTEISAEDALRRYRMGVRWQPGEFLDLNLFGEQSQGADTENALRLEGELRF